MVDDRTVLDLHPRLDGERFTLHGIFRDEDTALGKAAEYEDQGYAVLVFSEDAPSGLRLVFVARRREVGRMPRASLPHEHSADWEATRMAVTTFRRIERKQEDRDDPLEWYKPLDIERIRKCMLALSWKGTRLDVVSEIISTLITQHPFSNANHRTSLALGRLYLRSVDIRWPNYSLRGRGERRFFRDTHDYYRDSKYLLRLIRSRVPLRIAFEEGYTHVRVGPETVAEIREADLEATTEALRERHVERTRHLIRNLAGDEASARLGEPNTRTLREWVAWYQ